MFVESVIKPSSNRGQVVKASMGDLGHVSQGNLFYFCMKWAGLQPPRPPAPPSQLLLP